MAYSATPAAIITLVVRMQREADIEEDDEEGVCEDQDSDEDTDTQVPNMYFSQPVLCCIIASFNEARRSDFTAAALHEKS